MDRSAFERIAANLDAPMVIVTTGGEAEMDGCLVGFSTQCSIDPVRYLVCLSKANRTFELASEAKSLVVHVLHDEAHDRGLARLFGEETAHRTDKLSRCAWERHPEAAPVLTGCDWFAGSIIDRVDFGDHVGFVIDLDRGEAARADEPNLGFVDVQNFDAGNSA